MTSEYVTLATATWDMYYCIVCSYRLLFAAYFKQVEDRHGTRSVGF